MLRRGGKAHAQSKPTAGVEVAAGDYYIYNIGSGTYLNRGSSHTTHTTVDGAGSVITIYSSSGEYLLHFDGIAEGSYLGDGGWVDCTSTRDDYSTWTFESVTLDGYTNVYKMKANKNSYYLYWPGGDGEYGDEAQTAQDVSSVTADNTYWLLIPKATREAYEGASEDNPIDVTWHITDPDHERTASSGWTGSYSDNYRGKNGSSPDGTLGHFREKWVASGSSLSDGDLSQVLSKLPVGKYKLSANAWATQQSNASLAITGVTLFAGNEATSISQTPSTTPISVEFTSTGTDVTIGFKIASANANWAGFDNVRLAYLGALSDEEAKTAYEAALKAANDALTNSDYTNVTGSEKTALSNAVSEYANVTSNYDAATTALISATSTFTSAKNAYDSYVAEKAIADKLGATYDVTVNSAADVTVALQTLNVAEYNVSTTYTDVTSSLDKDWTSNTFDSQNAQHWSGETHKYFDYWHSSAATPTAEKTISLPAGTYILKACGRGAAGTTLTMAANGIAVTYPANGDTGYGINTSGASDFNSADTYANDNKGRGWEWRFIPITLTEAADVTVTVTGNVNNNWVGYCDFTILADATTAANLYATEAQYTALNNAINAVSSYVIGFEKGEYAPYENVDAVKALAAAKAIDQKATNTSSVVTAATTALQNVTWTVNAAELNAVNNGDFSEAALSASSGDANSELQKFGWTASDGLRLIFSSASTDNSWKERAAQLNGGKALFARSAQKYGETAGYTMPLKANTKYVLTFQYGSWENGDLASFNASVLNSSNQGLASYNFGTAKYAGTEMKSVKKIFTTGDAGDYVLTITGNGTANYVIANISIVKAVPDEITLKGDATEAPTASEYANVTLDRTFATGWNSVVLPFDTTPEALGADQAAEFTGTSEMTINFSSIASTGTLKANTPYLVHFTTASESPAFDGVKIAPTESLTVEDNGSQYDFVGTYVATTVKAGDYIVVEKGIQKAAGGNALKAFRAYFQAKEGAGAKTMSISIDGSVVTGIEAVAADAEDDAPAYNLAGQRVGKSYKGVVVKNGKKIIKK